MVVVLLEAAVLSPRRHRRVVPHRWRGTQEHTRAHTSCAPAGSQSFSPSSPPPSSPCCAHPNRDMPANRVYCFGVDDDSSLWVWWFLAGVSSLLGQFGAVAAAGIISGWPHGKMARGWGAAMCVLPQSHRHRLVVGCAAWRVQARERHYWYSGILGETQCMARLQQDMGGTVVVVGRCSTRERHCV